MNANKLNCISCTDFIDLIIRNKHQCYNEPPPLLVKTPKKTNRKTTRKMNFVDKGLQIISTNQYQKKIKIKKLSNN